MINDTHQEHSHSGPHSDNQIEAIKKEEEFQYQCSLTKQKLSDEQANQRSGGVTSASVNNHFNPSC